MARSDNMTDPVGVRCGILAIILAIAGIFIWAAGVALLVIPLSLIIAGLSGIFRNTILSTTAVIITTINSLYIMGEINSQERSFVGIPYLFAITCIIIGTLRSHAQNQREIR